MFRGGTIWPRTLCDAVRTFCSQTRWRRKISAPRFKSIKSHRSKRQRHTTRPQAFFAVDQIAFSRGNGMGPFMPRFAREGQKAEWLESQFNRSRAWVMLEPHHAWRPEAQDCNCLAKAGAAVDMRRDSLAG